MDSRRNAAANETNPLSPSVPQEQPGLKGAERIARKIMLSTKGSLHFVLAHPQREGRTSPPHGDPVASDTTAEVTRYVRAIPWLHTQEWQRGSERGIDVELKPESLCDAAAFAHALQNFGNAYDLQEMLPLWFTEEESVEFEHAVSNTIRSQTQKEHRGLEPFERRGITMGCAAECVMRMLIRQMLLRFQQEQAGGAALSLFHEKHWRTAQETSVGRYRWQFVSPSNITIHEQLQEIRSEYDGAVASKDRRHFHVFDSTTSAGRLFDNKFRSRAHAFAKQRSAFAEAGVTLSCIHVIFDTDWYTRSDGIPDGQHIVLFRDSETIRALSDEILRDLNMPGGMKRKAG